MSKINVYLFTFLLCFVGSVLCIQVQINNIHNGYKLAFRGEPVLLTAPPQTMALKNVHIIQNTLPHEQSVEQLISKNDGYTTVMLPELTQLSQLTDFEQSEGVIVTRWIDQPQYSLTIRLDDEDQTKNRLLFELIKTQTRTYQQEQF